MASGDITKEYDERALKGSLKPICGITLEIVVASGTSEKTEELDEELHPCMNCLLIDLYIKAPAIVTGIGNKFKLEINESDDDIYPSGFLNATNATRHPIHLQRGLKGKTELKLTTDGDVNENETFMIKLVGM